jgi:hypothetical protein
VTDTAARPGSRVDQPRTTFDVFLAAVPWAVLGLVVAAILLTEASVRHGPTTFIDELKWAELSRAIEETGRAARRGQAASFGSLYAYLIAPAWAFSSTKTAYTVIKFLNEIVMGSVCVPVYLLARQLVSRRLAVAAALGTLCTSAFFYAPQLLPEVLAYPTFGWCAYTAVRALSGGGRRWWIAAIALCGFAVLVRSQLTVVIPVLAIAAAWLWIVGPRGQRFRAGWSVLDHVGAAVLLTGAFIVANRAIGNHSEEWSNSTQAFQGRMWHLGLWAASALAIGLGLLPAMAGLASLWLPERRADPRWRAFAAYTAASIAMFGLYTMVKAAYLSTHFATLVEERNLIYLQPLLLIGAVTFFAARRPPLPVALVSIGLTTFLVLYYGYQLNYPYSEAPGYGIATMANRVLRWNQTDIRGGLAVASVVSAAIVLLPWLTRRGAVVRVAVAAGCLATAAWMLTAQITSVRGANVQSASYQSHLPPSQHGAPLDWLDLATHGAGVTYLGQKEPSIPLGIWLIEFWNRSLKNVWTLDGSGPPPTQTPQLLDGTGTLSNDPDLEYVLEDNGVQLKGQVLERFGDLILVRLRSHPWKLLQSVYNLTDDGWITPPLNEPDSTAAEGRYAYFGTGPGKLTVVVGRTGFCPGPDAPEAHVTVRVGTIALDSQGAPIVKQLTDERRFVLPNCAQRSVTLTTRGPLTVDVKATPTFRLTDYGGSDPRPLGAQVSYLFTPTR